MTQPQPNQTPDPHKEKRAEQALQQEPHVLRQTEQGAPTTDHNRQDRRTGDTKNGTAT